MIRRPPRSTQGVSSAASDVYKRQPDGRTIAFVSELDGDADIFTMDSSGQNQARITNNDSADTDPRW